MHAKQYDPPKPQPDVPSTGRGAASALEALIKKRLPVPDTGHGDGARPQQHPQQQQQQKKKQRQPGKR